MTLQCSVWALNSIEQRVEGIHHAINAQSQQMETLVRWHAESMSCIESLVQQTMGGRLAKSEWLRLPDETVRQCYREILGREPENQDVIDEHSQLGTIEALRRALMNSEEFSSRLSENLNWNIKRLDLEKKWMLSVLASELIM